MLLNDAEYIAFLTGGAQFITPTNPGPYLTVVDLNNPVVRAQQVAEHKQELIEFETDLGVTQTLCNKIESAVDPELVHPLPDFGIHALEPEEMLDHLQSNGIKLDNMDIAELIKQLYASWDLNENPATKFSRDNKIEKQLLKKNITAQPLVTGEYKIALKAFKSKPNATQMFVNFCTFIVAKYSKHFKNNCTKAKSVGFGITNQAITTQQRLSKEEACNAKMALALNKIVQMCRLLATRKWRHS
ncbi:LOW QUALITY PROTEIN: hypothetical protein ACHAW6_016078 [Cyclotella cf. meneghiniana]